MSTQLLEQNLGSAPLVGDRAIHYEIRQAFAGAEARLGIIQNTVAAAAYRMRQTLPPNTNEAVLTNLVYRGHKGVIPALSSPRIWFTDRPHEIMPTRTLYHVTSSLVLDSLTNKGEIIPPILHDLEVVVTHRGFGQKLLSRLLWAFGIDSGENDKFLWLGADVDMEQVAIEHEIGAAAVQINQELFETIFDLTHSRINDNLLAVLQCLERGEKPREIKNLEQYIEKLMGVLYKYTGVRDGWYNYLKGALLGDIPIDVRDLTTSTEGLLLVDKFDFAFFRDGVIDPSPSQVIVLEVDAQHMIDQVGNLYPVVISDGRAPRLIVSTPLLHSASVRRVFASDPETLNQEVVQKLGIPLDPISQLPPAVRLERTGNQKIVDPAQAVCIERHRQSALPIWSQHLLTGNLAPLIKCDLCGKPGFSSKKGLLDIFGWELLFDTSSPLDMLRISLKR